MELDLEKINRELNAAEPADVVRWALALNRPAIVTTSFGRNAAAMLHLVSQVDDSVPVVWVDTGYNLRETYLVAERLIADLQLSMHVYAPEMTSERRNALMGGIPAIEDKELHEEFTRQVKLEPFERALRELQPEVWLTGIRREETEYRQSLDVVSLDGRGVLKVAPLFHWSEADLDAYMRRYQLPTCRHYFDPTKVLDGRECGLHTAA
jgi:phosphoadenosine phosphosulfate reductase